jgi:hypothetical protein
VDDPGGPPVHHRTHPVPDLTGEPPESGGGHD